MAYGNNNNKYNKYNKYNNNKGQTVDPNTNQVILIPTSLGGGNIALVKELEIINHAWEKKTLGGKGRDYFYKLVQAQIPTVLKGIIRLISYGLSLATKDYYIHQWVNKQIAVVAHYTGAMRMLVKKAENQGERLVWANGAITSTDIFNFTSSNGIDNFEISKSTHSILHGGTQGEEYISSWCTATVYNQQGVMILRKTVVVPVIEFSRIIAIADDKDDNNMSTEYRLAFAEKISIWRCIKIIKTMYGMEEILIEELPHHDNTDENQQSTNQTQLNKPQQFIQKPTNNQMDMKNDTILLTRAIKEYAFVMRKDKMSRAKFEKAIMNDLLAKRKVQVLGDMTIEDIAKVTKSINERKAEVIQDRKQPTKQPESQPKQPEPQPKQPTKQPEPQPKQGINDVKK